MMNGNTLATQIAASLGVTDAKAIADLTTLCVAIITHIQTNALVTISPGAVAATSTGPAPVTGTATIA